MITLDEINGEISKLQAQPPTYQTIGVLADLYIVRDAMQRTEIPQESSTEFRQACSGNPDALTVFDELMSTLQIVQPKLYECVMRKLTTI